LNRAAATVAAALVLIAADGALAKGNNGGSHDHGQDHSDHSQMKSQSFKSDHSDKHSDKYKDKSGEMRADKHKDKDSKHADKMKDNDDDKHAEKTKDKDKTTTTTTTANGNTPATPAPGSDKDLFGKGIVGPNANLKPVPGSPAPAPGATPGPTAGNNTIHPIPGSAAPAPATGSGNGIIRVTDQRGNSVIIPDHGSGVTVTPSPDGRSSVVISNGVDSRTVSGIALTISGAKTVSVDKSLGTGPRQADGSTTVLTPNGTVTNEPVLPGSGFEANAGGQHYP
jgi:hypothetical protein